MTTAKIKNNAVTTAKLKNEAVTGTKINEATLGEVPLSTTANNLTGQTPFFIRLGFGASQTIATNGAVSFVATCDQVAGKDRVRILFQTAVNGAVANGDDNYNGEGPTFFLNVATPPDEREFVSLEDTTGKTNVGHDIDEGFVLGPEGKMLTANSEGIALGINYGAPGCLVAGVANAVG